MITKNTSDIHMSEQVVLNKSKDDKFDVLAVELLGYDPLGKDGNGDIVGSLNRISISALGDYGTNDIEKTGSFTYIGKESASGSYIVQRLTEGSTKSLRYATEKNNGTVTSYTDAWTNRASLTYGTYSEAFS